MLSISQKLVGICQLLLQQAQPGASKICMYGQELIEEKNQEKAE
jgi:hypothetical protein